MNLAKYRFIIVSVLISLILFVIYHFMFYTKWQKELGQLKKELSALETELSSARQAIRDLPRLEKEIKSLEYKWQLSQRLLPPEEKIDDVIRLITQRAMESGVKVIELTRGSPTGYTARPTPAPAGRKPGTPAPVAPGGIQQIPLGLKIKSDFYSLCEFLAQISTLHRLITTWNVNISSKIEDGYTLEGNLQARIYTFGGAK